MWLISNKTRIKDSGLFDGLCDWHCHLLPAVDDGVQDVSESVYILTLLGSLGVKEVWLTPHVMEDVPNGTDFLRKKFGEFQSAYNGGIKLHLGTENMLDGLFMQRLAAHDFITIGAAGKHLLIETSYFNPPWGMYNIINEVKEKGYVPVLAHPERYQYMNTEHYKKLKQMGMFFQLNLPSLVGIYGIEVQKKAEQMLKAEMYDCCGTDIHSLHALDILLNSKINKKYISMFNKTLLNFG